MKKYIGSVLVTTFLMVCSAAEADQVSICCSGSYCSFNVLNQSGLAIKTNGGAFTNIDQVSGTCKNYDTIYGGSLEVDIVEDNVYHKVSSQFNPYTPQASWNANACYIPLTVTVQGTSIAAGAGAFICAGF